MYRKIKYERERYIHALFLSYTFFNLIFASMFHSHLSYIHLVETLCKVIFILSINYLNNICKHYRYFNQ